MAARPQEGVTLPIITADVRDASRSHALFEKEFFVGDHKLANRISQMKDGSNAF
jgi:hypothetical protein